jgi:cyclic beta-1,2-glucan synthetase
MAFAALGQRERAWGVFDLINPVHHVATTEGMARYKVEPYVVAADVYSVAPHTGRGGWSWYTGSAGWMYRLVVESLLGLRLQTTEAGARLLFAPCLPADWAGYALTYRYRGTSYAIEVTASPQVAAGATEVRIDGRRQEDGAVALQDDGTAHEVEVRVPAMPAAPAVSTG